MGSNNQPSCRYVVLIPAYRPNAALVELVQGLVHRGVQRIVVTDDGSPEDCAPIFRELEELEQCEVVHHAVNLGKGRALKTGLNHIYLTRADAAGVVTCDADGQHHPDDVVQVGEKLAGGGRSLILGCRTFGAGVPLRSLIGNFATKYIFYFVVGKKLSDTQSGLRGLPIDMLPDLIRLDGEKYEYEMNMLLLAKDRGFAIVEVPIFTIYKDNNATSHFNPLFDSMKIYFVLLRFGFTSLFTSLLDQVFFFLSYRSGLPLAQSMVVGRLLSSVFNLSVNRTFVFKSRAQVPAMILRYYLAMAIAGVVAYAMISFLTESFDWPVMRAKISVESLLFLASFVVNRDFIFTQKEKTT